MSGGRSGARSGRQRSFQRCYRRAWIEHRTGARYEGVRAIVRRAGLSLRQVSDGDIERMVRAKRDERREHRARVDRVARAVGRSRRWVSEAARRLGVELSEDAIGRLGEERDRVERVRRGKIGRGRGLRTSTHANPLGRDVTKSWIAVSASTSARADGAIEVNCGRASSAE
jgi:hypothetical protein